MPTFYERYLLYQQRPDAIQFSKKRLKKIHGAIANVWNKRLTNPPLEYVKSTEPGADWEVRNYPATFNPTIDAIIRKFHKAYASPPPLPLPKPVRLRTRKPVKKPVYSTRKAS